MSSSSSTVFKEVERQLTCPVCLDHYTQPRTLPCLHSFCHDCLAGLPPVQQQADQLISCPVCRQSVQFPPNGLSGFHPAFLINSLLEIHELLQKVSGPQQQPKCEICPLKQSATGYCKQCSKFLCVDCVNTHNKWALFSDHSFVSMQDVIESTMSLVPLKQTALQHCSQHDKPLELHCSTCDQLICHLCSTLQHHSHMCKHIDDAFQIQQEIITNGLVAVEEKLATLSRVVESLELQEKKALEQGKTMKKEIHSRVQKLIQILEESKQRLNTDVDTVICSYLEEICTQKSEVTSLFSQLKSCEEFTKEQLRIGSQQEIVLMKRHMVERMNYLCSLIEDSHTQPTKEIKFRFAPSVETFTPCSIGSLIQFSDFDASVKNKLSFTARDAVLDIPISSGTLSCKLSPFADPTVAVKCELLQFAEDKFEFTYSPSSPGPHLLAMQIYKVAIDSPLNPIIVPSRQLQVGQSFSLSCPVGVAISQKGNIIVAENKNNCICILDRTSGAVLRRYGLKQFRCLLPFGVAVTSSGQIVVADQFSHRILLLKSDGMLISSTGSEGAGHLQFKHPLCIAVHSNGKIFITDCSNNRVQVLNPDLTYSHSFGKKGSQPSKFNTPFGIAIDSKGLVYVADSGNLRIQKFTSEGALLAVFGDKGDNSSTPTGLCIDDNDVLYVTDSFKNTVSLYSTRGHFLGYVGHSDGSSFSIPQDVTVDHTGRVFISHKDGLVMYTY